MTAMIIHLNNSLALLRLLSSVQLPELRKMVIMEQVPHPNDDVLLIPEDWLGN